MPIHPSMKERYPKNWPAISKRIRFERAGNRCEWCDAENYKLHPQTGSRVVLTVAHLDHDPGNNDESNRRHCARPAITATTRLSATATASTASCARPGSCTSTSCRLRYLDGSFQ